MVKFTKDEIIIPKATILNLFMVLFVAFILFLLFSTALFILLTPSEDYSINQSFELVGSEAFVHYNVSVSNSSYFAFPHELTYKWTSRTSSRIDRDKTSMVAKYVDSNGNVSEKKIPVEYDPMSFDLIITSVPSKLDGARLSQISGDVCIHNPKGPDAISFIQIKPIEMHFWILKFIPRNSEASTRQSNIVFEF